MRFALVAFGTRGDVQPLIALGVRLRSDGHEVVVGASDVFTDAVRGHGLEFHVVGRDIDALLRDHAQEVIGRSARSIRPVLRLLRDEIDHSFDQTYEAAAGADLLVAGMHLAAPSVAEALGIPHRTLVYCPQVLRSRHHPPMGVPWFGLPPFANELLAGLVSHLLDVGLADAINRHRRRHGLRAIGRVAEHLCSARAILASDPLLGERPPDAPPGVVQVGSLALAGSQALDPALERFLELGEPPVCVGFGSMPDPDPRRTTDLIAEALADCGRRGVILSGWSELGGDGVPPGIFVARSAPHAALLPRVAMAVHHGGAGTTAAAARAGVPQIVVPHVADQYYWGEHIRRRGLGPRAIPRRELTARRLARAMREVLANPEYAERARDVRIALARTDGVTALARLLYRALPESEDRRLAA
jgi:UDP:flavonoid glycosyltransferase YjiC (YdhE family)